MNIDLGITKNLTRYLETDITGSSQDKYTFSFFPDPVESGAIHTATSDQIVDLINRQPNLTARILHELLITGREDVLQQTVNQIGTESISIAVNNNDWIKLLAMLTHDFVPEKEILRVLCRFYQLGIEVQDNREHFIKIPDCRISKALDAVPDIERLTDYAQRVISGQIEFRTPGLIAENVCMVDPRRHGLPYIGLGRINNNYDWVIIDGVNGFQKDAHYQFYDPETNIAMINRY